MHYLLPQCFAILITALVFVVSAEDFARVPRQATSPTASPSEPTFSASKYRYLIGPWSDDEKQKEAEAWDGALQLAQALAMWKPGDNTGGNGGGYQDAMDMYFGKSS